MRPAQRTIAWRADYEGALAAARRSGRLVAVHFWLEGRPLYRAMNEETFADPRVVQLSEERFVNVRVDIGLRSGLFERIVGGKGGLGTAIVDAIGDTVSVLVGFSGPERYLEFLGRALSGHAPLEAARRAAARAPGDPAARLRLAEAYESLGSMRRAEEEFEASIRLGKGPGHPKAFERFAAHAHERLARILALRGKNREAAAHLEAYRRIDPEDRSARRDRALVTDAIVAWIERRFRDANRILEGALRDHPSSAERDRMLLVLGTVRHESGDDTRALALLEQLLRDHPRSQVAAQAREQIDHIRNPPPEHSH